MADEIIKERADRSAILRLLRRRGAGRVLISSGEQVRTDWLDWGESPSLLATSPDGHKASHFVDRRFPAQKEIPSRNAAIRSIVDAVLAGRQRHAGHRDADHH